MVQKQWILRSQRVGVSSQCTNQKSKTLEDEADEWEMRAESCCSASPGRLSLMVPAVEARGRKRWHKVVCTESTRSAQRVRREFAESRKEQSTAQQMAQKRRGKQKITRLPGLVQQQLDSLP